MAAKRKGAHVSLAKQEVPWESEKQRRTAATAAIPPPMIVKTETGQWCAVRSHVWNVKALATVNLKTTTMTKASLT